MLNWFKTLLGRRPLPVAPEEVDPDHADLRSLDIPGAIAAHLNWRKRLRDVIHGESSEVLDVQVVSADCHCALGKWIYSDGQSAYGHLPMYEDLRVKHADFHTEAGRVLQQAQNGQRTQAQRLLLTTFAQRSNDVLGALNNLEAQALGSNA